MKLKLIDKAPKCPKCKIALHESGTSHKQLKEFIKKRDKYRCQTCFIHQKDITTRKGQPRPLNVHHIDYNKHNNSPNNMISLCTKDHSKINFNREYWTEHFEEMMIK